MRKKRPFCRTGLENNHQDVRNVFYVWHARLIDDLSAFNFSDTEFRQHLPGLC
jgi:hypothetical protein